MSSFDESCATIANLLEEFDPEKREYLLKFFAKTLQSIPCNLSIDSPPRKKYDPSERLETYGGFLEKDVRMVAQQTDCPLEEALKAMVKFNGDIVSAIMDITW